MLALLASLLVRVEVLGLLHPHAAAIDTPRGTMRIRAVGDTIHEGVGPPLPRLVLAPPGPRQKPLTVKVEKLPKRAFAGSLEVRAEAGVLHFFNQLPLDEYVASVVGAEMPSGPIEAQKALAVVARSFAFKAISRGDSNPVHADAPLCDQTHCQLYAGVRSATRSARKAALDTASIALLLSSGKVAPALHHAACGGGTSTAREVWPGADDEDELASASVDDRLPSGAPACAPGPKEPTLDWRAELSEAEVAKALGAALPLSLQIERGPDGRLKTLAANGGPRLGADEVHLRLGRLLGWNRIRSSRIYWAEPDHDLSQRAHPEVSPDPIRFAVRGSGFGHGVGLCQRGAVRWARNGETYSQILSHYFPKLIVGRLPKTPDPG